MLQVRATAGLLRKAMVWPANALRVELTDNIIVTAFVSQFADYLSMTPPEIEYTPLTALAWPWFHTNPEARVQNGVDFWILAGSYLTSLHIRECFVAQRNHAVRHAVHVGDRLCTRTDQQGFTKDVPCPCIFASVEKASYDFS